MAFFSYIIHLKLKGLTPIRLTLLFTVLTLLFPEHCFAQRIFRRHFIIAYDISPPFVRSERNTPEYAAALTALFKNQRALRFTDADTDNLVTEKKNGLRFFDPAKDEVSFFHFNLSADEMTQLRYDSYSKTSDYIVKEFETLFIKDKNIFWSSFSTAQSSVGDYFDKALATAPTESYFGRGVSMSSFVFPLVIDQVNTNQYADEYILIILSDFLTGSELGNKQDMDRIRDIFQAPYGKSLSANSPISHIKNQIDFLSSQYYKVDYFQYVFQPYFYAKQIAIIAYKIRPKAGNFTPENISLFVDGDLHLEQHGYKSENFETNATSFKFTHNKLLKPTRLRLNISKVSGGKTVSLFNEVIASRQHERHWSSSFTNDSNLMDYDSLQATYYLPKLTLKIDSNINHKNYDALTFSYSFDAQYLGSSQHPLNLIYTTERTVPLYNIDFSTKITMTILFIAVPLIVLLTIVFLLIDYGKPIDGSMEPSPFLDSYEKFDYRSVGKIKVPYCPWPDDLDVEKIRIRGFLFFKKPNYLFNWKPKVKITLVDYKAPDGFEVFISPENREYGLNLPMFLKAGKNDSFSFFLGLRLNAISSRLQTPQPITVIITMIWKERRLGLTSKFKAELNGSFYIGPELGDVWVGFDPGTSGSCSAVGSSTENILLGRDSGNNAIVDSKLIFETELNLPENHTGVPKELYKYGRAATVKFSSSQVTAFQSIKKLLGYKNTATIKFKNGNSLHLSGKQLAGLLIDGLYEDLKTTVERTGAQKEEYYRDETFNPKRAVIAIPNNFTLPKIQDIVDCVLHTNQFAEIRCVYEAEAILFYYLANFNSLNTGAAIPNHENVMIFDMGGATINASIMSFQLGIRNNSPVYDIDYQSKIGYGIGGDTIDYCILSFLKSFGHKHPELNKIDLTKNNKNLSEMAFSIKRDMIDNFIKKADRLVLTVNLEAYIKKAFDLTAFILSEDGNISIAFKKDSIDNSYPILRDDSFTKLIYHSVKDATDEAMGLAGNIKIDKIIFSGRSTAFPLIKETVTYALAQKKMEFKAIVLDLEESKTAVAFGATWYGINKNSVALSNLKTNSSFGIRKTSSNISDILYLELIAAGTPFQQTEAEYDSLRGVKSLNDNFAFDGGKIKFYQVMGKNAEHIISENQRHKFSRISQISLPQLPKQAAIEVNANDEVSCLVELDSGRIINHSGHVSDQDIDDENDDHYTWTLK